MCHDLKKGGGKAMSGRKDRRGLWDGNGFEDIRSHSTGEPPQFGLFTPREEGGARRTAREPGNQPSGRAGTSSQRPRGSRDTRRGREPARPPSKGKGRERPASRSQPGKSPRPGSPRPGQPPSSRPRGRPEPPPRKRKKPMSRGKRRFLMVLAMAAMLLGTGFFLESILLRVSAVRVTGDAVYPEEEILRICNYKTGDNLLFIPTGSREERLEKELPYIAEAKISRRIPGTVVVRITAARPACCFQSGSQWVVVESGGKVLETRNDPPEGLMQVTGLNPPAVQPGEKLVLEDEGAAKAFGEIVEAIAGLDAVQNFTRLDMGDLSKISLWYENRVQCVLGGVNELTRKVQYGYGLFNSDRPDTIGPQATGVLDLSYLPSNSRSYFSEGAVSPESGQPPVQGQGAAEGGGQQDPGPAGGSPEPTSAPGRGSGIPDQPYTGG